MKLKMDTVVQKKKSNIKWVGIIKNENILLYNVWWKFWKNKNINKCFLKITYYNKLLLLNKYHSV
jgi:hypothetical protein